MSNINIKYLGIDFGSSSVSVVGYEDKDKEPIIFYDKLLNDKYFATAMTEDKTGYFQYAFNTSADIAIIDSLKEDIGQGIRIDYVEEYMKVLFKIIKKCRKDSIEYNFSTLKRVCFGHPTYTSPTNQSKYCENLRDIIFNTCQSVFGTSQKIEIIYAPEPVLAVIAYNEAHQKVNEYKNKIKDGDLILVADFGGYTLDMTVIQANKCPEDDSISICPITAPASIENGRMDIKMGKQITEELCIQIYKNSTILNVNGEKRDTPLFDYSVEKSKTDFFQGNENDTTPQTMRVESTLTKDGKTKIKKFVLQKNQIGSSIKGDTIYVGIYTSEDDRSINIENCFIQCAEHINYYINLNKDRLNNKKVSHIIFTGGTARIKALRETVIRHICQDFIIPIPNVLWVDKETDDGALRIKDANKDKKYVKLASENVVALGAAVKAAWNTDVGRTAAARDPVLNSDSIHLQKMYDELKEKHMRYFRIVENFLDGPNICEKCRNFLDSLLSE